VPLPNETLVTTCTSFFALAPSNTLGVTRFQNFSVPLRLQQEADGLKVTRKRRPQKIPMVIKQAESGLHLMSVALNLVVNFLGPIGRGVGERVTGIGRMIHATVNFCRSVTSLLVTALDYPVACVIMEPSRIHAQTNP
jgi:hypothetical protein